MFGRGAWRTFASTMGTERARLGGGRTSSRADASSHNVGRKEAEVPLDFWENNGFYEGEGLVPAARPEHNALCGEDRELSSRLAAVPPLRHKSARPRCKKASSSLCLDTCRSRTLTNDSWVSRRSPGSLENVNIFYTSAGILNFIKIDQSTDFG